MGSRDRLLDQIRRLALQGMGERRTDGQLLEQFISERDEAAFALLLRRHGAMVWSVCHRVLGNAHDADDAFQAAFLVLVRKADSVRPREAVGNWLYGVAYRTAMEARGRIARRRAKELPLQDVPSPQTKAEESGHELRSILDRELSRLADKYRLPIVLCDLEGRSRKEVAQQLAIPEGTLSSRLATARKKLAARLTRLGFVVSGASLMALLTESTATAGMGPSLFTSTTKAALLIAAGPAAVAGVVSATVSTLTEGVLKTMFIAKIKTTALVLCSVAALGVGTGGVYYQTRAVGAADPPGEIQREQEPSPKSSRKAKRDKEDWKAIAEDLRKQLQLEREKAKLTEQELRGLLLKLRDDNVVKETKINAMKTEAQVRERTLQEEIRRIRDYKVALDPAKPDLEHLEQIRKRLVADYQQQWNELQRQQSDLGAKQKELKAKQQKLEEVARERIARLDMEKAKIIQAQSTNQPNPKNNPRNGGEDKLDQILQRLKQLENRLDRLEKRKGEINFTNPQR